MPSFLKEWKFIRFRVILSLKQLYGLGLANSKIVLFRMTLGPWRTYCVNSIFVLANPTNFFPKKMLLFD